MRIFLGLGLHLEMLGSLAACINICVPRKVWQL
jgi:hypothetical protein